MCARSIYETNRVGVCRRACGIQPIQAQNLVGQVPSPGVFRVFVHFCFYRLPEFCPALNCNGRQPQDKNPWNEWLHGEDDPGHNRFNQSLRKQRILAFNRLTTG